MVILLVDLGILQRTEGIVEKMDKRRGQNDSGAKVLPDEEDNPWDP